MGRRHVKMAGEKAPRDRAVLKSLFVQAWSRPGEHASSASVSSAVKQAMMATLMGRAKPDERRKPDGSGIEWFDAF